MNPTIITFPTIAPADKFDWKINRYDARNTSPLSGTFQDIVRAGATWTCDMSWNVLSYSDSQLLQAWAVQMSRGGYRSLITQLAYTIQGSGLGSPLIDGASQTGNSLITNGWTASKTNVLMAGDLIGVYIGSITFTLAVTNGYAITFKDYYGNSYSIGTGTGSQVTWALPTTFYTGYSVYVNNVLQNYTTNYTTTMQHQLLMMTANASSNASGVATLNFEPILRFSPVSGTAVSLTPAVVMAFSKPDSSISYTAPRIASFSLSLQEDITL